MIMLTNHIRTKVINKNKKTIVLYKKINNL